MCQFADQAAGHDPTHAVPVVIHKGQVVAIASRADRVILPRTTVLIFGQDKGGGAQRRTLAHQELNRARAVGKLKGRIVGNLHVAVLIEQERARAEGGVRPAVEAGAVFQHPVMAAVLGVDHHRAAVAVHREISRQGGLSIDRGAIGVHVGGVRGHHGERGHGTGESLSMQIGHHRFEGAAAVRGGDRVQIVAGERGAGQHRRAAIPLIKERVVEGGIDRVGHRATVPDDRVLGLADQVGARGAQQQVVGAEGAGGKREHARFVQIAEIGGVIVRSADVGIAGRGGGVAGIARAAGHAVGVEGGDPADVHDRQMHPAIRVNGRRGAHGQPRAEQHGVNVGRAAVRGRVDAQSDAPGLAGGENPAAAAAGNAVILGHRPNFNAVILRGRVVPQAPHGALTLAANTNADLDAFRAAVGGRAQGAARAVVNRVGGEQATRGRTGGKGGTKSAIVAAGVRDRLGAVQMPPALHRDRCGAGHHGAAKAGDGR